MAAAVLARLERDSRPMPRALNATGVILHSGLGPRAARRPGRRGRGRRRDGLRAARSRPRARQAPRARHPLRRDSCGSSSGAEDGLFVNNNAAATVLVLNTVARRKEVVCSRGEMVEIGGSFRIPDVMGASGCKLVPVGTTNKTHLADYEAAITPKLRRPPRRPHEQLQDRRVHGAAGARRGLRARPRARDPGHPRSRDPDRSSSPRSSASATSLRCRRASGRAPISSA